MKLDAEVFLDAAYLIALAQPGDQHHPKPRQLAQTLNTARTRIVTTRAVLLEVGNALSKVKLRSTAVPLLETFEETELVEILPLTEDLAREGWELFRRRPDKEWSWTDCVSFVVMRERSLRQALTTDEHFEQAGFAALLRP